MEKPKRFDQTKYRAVLFDLDGVITQTAKLHSAAWKEMFDDYLRLRSERTGEEFVEFDINEDYKQHIDGKPRYDGVRDFLAARGITLPEGENTDPPTTETVRGLGNRKNELIVELIHTRGVETYDSTVQWARELHESGVKTAVVSASKNCAAVLEVTGIASLFDLRVDGLVAAERGLPGKPAPDTFLEAAREFGVPPSAAVVVEDAIAGITAGRAGGFGLVIGVDRKGDAASLWSAGADIVVPDLAKLER